MILSNLGAMLIGEVHNVKPYDIELTRWAGALDHQQKPE